MSELTLKQLMMVNLLLSSFAFRLFICKFILLGCLASYLKIGQMEKIVDAKRLLDSSYCVDFENASHNVLKPLFVDATLDYPYVTVIGCMYHLKNALHQKLS